MVDSFDFRCPDCDQLHRAALGSHGSASNCEKCGARFLVPSSSGDGKAIPRAVPWKDEWTEAPSPNPDKQQVTPKPANDSTASKDSCITVQCLSCGKPLKCPTAAAGRTGKCSDCGAEIRIPEPTSSAPRLALMNGLKLSGPLLAATCIVASLLGGMLVVILAGNGAKPDEADIVQSEEDKPTATLSERSPPPPPPAEQPKVLSPEAISAFEALSALESRVTIGTDYKTYASDLASCLHSFKRFERAGGQENFPSLSYLLSSAVYHYRVAGWGMRDRLRDRTGSTKSFDSASSWRSASKELKEAATIIKAGGAATTDDIYREVYRKKNANREPQPRQTSTPSRTIAPEAMERPAERPKVLSPEAISAFKALSTLESHLRVGAGSKTYISDLASCRQSLKWFEVTSRDDFPMLYAALVMTFGHYKIAYMAWRGEMSLSTHDGVRANELLSTKTEAWIEASSMLEKAATLIKAGGTHPNDGRMRKLIRENPKLYRVQ